MSHLTTTKTHFKNLLYLEKALVKLKIPNFNINSLTSSNDLILSKNNGLSFNWNGKFFDAKVDYDFWNQEYSFSHFLNRIKQEYATEAIINESRNFGFLPTKLKPSILEDNNTYSMTIERYNIYEGKTVL